MKKILLIIFFHLTMSYTEKETQQLASLISKSKTVLIGAGAGLSTSAGFTMSGDRYDKYFVDFKYKYNLNDMYSLFFLKKLM